MGAYEKARQRAARAKRHSSSATRDSREGQLPLSVRRGRGRPEEVEVLLPLNDHSYGAEVVERSARGQWLRTKKC